MTPGYPSSIFFRASSKTYVKLQSAPIPGNNNGDSGSVLVPLEALADCVRDERKRLAHFVLQSSEEQSRVAQVAAIA